jgi:hypothetical protein
MRYLDVAAIVHLYDAPTSSVLSPSVQRRKECSDIQVIPRLLFFCYA